MPVKITAHDLRRLAERADALRGEDLFLEIDAEGKAQIVRAADTPNTTGSRPVAVRTDDAPGHPPLEAATLHRPSAGQAVRVETASGFDAAFWKESAVQKFVFPYYAATASRERFDTIWSAYWSATAQYPIYAVLHDRSEPRRLRATGGPEQVGISMSVLTEPASGDVLQSFKSLSPTDEALGRASEGIFNLEDFAEILTQLR